MPAEPSMETLAGKVAVVTGAAGGIGRSIALALADEGADVVVSDVQPEPLGRVADEIRGRGARALEVVCDVADAESVEKLAGAAFAQFHRVDVLCNNAGVSWRPYRGILDATLDDWRYIMGVNLYGIVHGLNSFLPRMRRQQGRKHIVNTCSIAALVPLEGHTVYTASKAAAVGLSESMAGELRPHGFGVTILCPGQIPTGLGENADRLRPGDGSSFEAVEVPTMERLAAFRMASPDPIGGMVCRAILEDRLYLHPTPLPADLVADRVHAWFGGQTLDDPARGRAPD